MKTTMPISTISYNTPEYLELKLNELLKAHIIQFWAYVWHMPEVDERKAHIHLYVEPAKSFQTEELRDELREICEGEKPLGCMPFNKSKFGDWYLYSSHDKAYLSSKGQSRQFHYRRDAFKASDFDYFDELVRNINMLALTPYQILTEAFEHGDTFNDIIRRGQIPIQQLTAFKLAFDALSVSGLNRNGYSNHEEEDLLESPDGIPVPDRDPEGGVISD